MLRCVLRSAARDRRPAPAAMLAALLAVGCAGPDSAEESSADEPMLVLAAASLGDAMPVLIDNFENATDVRIDLATGATGSLAAQIENGAPADLFFAADETTVERLVGSGAIRGTTVRSYATGELALVWRDDIVALMGPAELTDRRYEVIAIANPEIAPYGAAAREALIGLGSWTDLSSRIVQAENVAQAYQMVRTGNVDAAFVASSILDSARPFLLIDSGLHTPIRQAAGILEDSVHPAAEAFLDFVLSDWGQALLVQHGFGRAPE